MIDGDSPRWHLRVLVNAAENLATFEPGEREPLIALFKEADQRIIRAQLRRLDPPDEAAA